MSKKIFITISVVLVLFLVCLLGYYFLTKGSAPTDGGIVSGFKDFFPFGGNENTNTPQATTTTNEQSNNQNNNQTVSQNFVAKLRKISSEPVSGAGLTDVKAGTIVRYIEKATGHIFEVELFSPKISRISNTTIPLSYDAIWFNKNNSIMARYLEEDNQTVNTYSLNINNKSTTTDNVTTGIIFPDNISDVSTFGSTVFYLVQNTNTSSGFTSNFDGKNKKQIWNSDIKELSSQYVNDRTVALTTKPAPKIPGYLYFVDPITGGVKKVLGNIDGLSALVSPDALKVLYLEQNGSTKMSVYTIKNVTYAQMTPSTMPEKCVWGRKSKDLIFCAVPKKYFGGDNQELWYKGLLSFSDDIWVYDLKNNTSNLIENLEGESGEKIDVIKPMLSDSEQYLVFMNKTDNSLWSLDLSKISTPTTPNI